MAVLSDPISDFLTRLKNASRAGNEFFTAPHSKTKESIAKILEAEGYIWNYEVSTEGTPLRWCGRNSACPQWPRHFHRLHFQRTEDRHSCT